MLKSFYRFWFKPNPALGIEHCAYAYSDSLQAASDAVSKRIGGGVLTGRVEPFELKDAGQFVRRGNLESNLCHADLFALCKDLQATDLSQFDRPTLRLIQSLYDQECGIYRGRDPKYVGHKLVPKKLLEAAR